MRSISILEYTLLFSVLLPLMIYAQDQESWVSRYENTGETYGDVRMAVDVQGNVFVTGDIETYDTQWVTVKYNRSGTQG